MTDAFALPPTGVPEQAVANANEKMMFGLVVCKPALVVVAVLQKPKRSSAR